MLLSGNKLLRLMYYSVLFFGFFLLVKIDFCLLVYILFCLFWKCLIEFSLFICFVFWKSFLHGDQRTSFCLCLLSVCQVMYISVHRCHCWLVCLIFCVVFSFLFSDVEVYKDGLLCTRIFYRCRK